MKVRNLEEAGEVIKKIVDGMQAYLISTIYEPTPENTNIEWIKA
jgi:hypothetical protein